MNDLAYSKNRRFGLLIMRCIPIAIVLTSFLIWVGAVFASDCPPGGYQDCTAAASTAQSPLVPLAGAVVGVVLNGVFQGDTRVLAATTGILNNGEEEDEEDVRYTLDIRTENERMILIADNKDKIWIYAKLTCSKPSVNWQSLTSGLRFEFEGEYANWLSIEHIQVSGDYMAGLLRARPPLPDAEMSEDAKVTIVVSGSTADGEPIHAPVSLELEAELELQVTIIS